MNPNHDPRTGEFSSGSSNGAAHHESRLKRTAKVVGGVLVGAGAVAAGVLLSRHISAQHLSSQTFPRKSGDFWSHADKVEQLRRMQLGGKLSSSQVASLKRVHGL